MRINIRFFLSAVLLVMGISAATARGTAGNDGVDVVLLGDSNTWLGGDGCDRPLGWSKWFRDVFAPATCRSYARSGATWTNTERTVRDVEEYSEVLGDNNVIYNQINRLVDAVKNGSQTAPDLIVVAAGTNDAWFRKDRPQVFDKTADEIFNAEDSSITGRLAGDVLTLAESVRYGCELLVGAFPEARIVLLTPLQSTAVSTEYIRRTGDIIEQCGRRMSIGVIRQDGDGFVCRESEAKSKRMTTDGTHTSEEGARRNGTRIAQMIKTMNNVRCTMNDER